MAVTLSKNAFVVGAATPISLSGLVNVTAAASNPAYLVLSGLDRNEYTPGASGATGTLTGNGNTDRFSSIGGDGRGIGIVFTYQASSGRYYSSTYGYLDQLTYTASASLNDVTNLSLFGTSNASLANAYANTPYGLMQTDAAGYLGSITVATQPAFSGPVPAQATPDSIAATAAGFVGKAWNQNGCWVLASTIAAEAGASLPVQSTAIGVPGQANGEWFVAFNGPAGQSGNWQSMVTAGEVIVIGTSGGGGHVTTCVAGSGSSAQLIDNITYVNGSGQIVNPANDGSASDVTIAAPHPASQEWSSVQAGSVVIYELDTPVVTAATAPTTLASGGKTALGGLLSATDPEGKAVTQYQVYDSATSDSLVTSGGTVAAHSAATAVTISSLSAVTLQAGATACIDTLSVRASNGQVPGRLDHARRHRGGQRGRCAETGHPDREPDLAAGRQRGLRAAGGNLRRSAGPETQLRGHADQRPAAAGLARLQRRHRQLQRRGAGRDGNAVAEGHRHRHRRSVGQRNLPGDGAGGGAGGAAHDAGAKPARRQAVHARAGGQHFRRPARPGAALCRDPGQRAGAAGLDQLQCRHRQFQRHRPRLGAEPVDQGHGHRHQPASRQPKPSPSR